ncbi:indolethylamine N-methyltransferase-like [Pseudophryne corroboree]|uniref:indolethylamine N-methyltransferase-like n=1 Tax=Pseudophryne corroboree TaxID=495146 RepID=UPI0030820DB1
MDPSAVKNYYLYLHEYDPKDFLTMYLSPTSDKQLFYEIVIFPMKELQKLNISGDVLIDFTTGPVILQLLPICKNFNEFIVLEAKDSFIKELEKWVKKEERGFDWNHLSQYFPELGSDWEKWLEKEEILRKRVKNVKKCDLDKANPTEPFVLEKVDCVLSAYVMQQLSKDKDSYLKNLKKIIFLHKSRRPSNIGWFI